MNPRKMISSLSACFALLLIVGTAAAAPKVFATLDKQVLNFSAVQPNQQVVAAVVLQVKDGFHLQSHTPAEEDASKFEMKPSDNPAVAFLDPVYPAGEDRSYKFSLKPLNVYTGRIVVYLPLQVKGDAALGALKLSGVITFQACDDNSCYPPTHLPFSIDARIVAAGEAIEPNEAALFKDLPPTVFREKGAAPIATEKAGESPDGTKFFGFELRHNSYVLAFVAAFIAGIIFNAVPCVLPVLPLKAIGFYEVSQHNRAKCLAFGAVFSLGVITTFAALALLIVVYKKVGWGEIYSNPWFAGAIVVVLLIMAVGTFGAFTVNLPVGIYNITPRHDTYLGNFLFGILTAILSTPCTFGLFLGLLVWAASQPPAIGVSLVMTVGAGMASPYFVLSAFPELARRFPRTGPWSELVKQLMAFLLLGSAVFFARRFLERLTGAELFWWTLFAVAVLAAGFLAVRSVQISKRALPRAVGLGIAILIVVGAYFPTRALADQPYAWTDYSEKTLASARDDRRVIVVDFTAAWCTTCQYLEVHTLHAPNVVKAVKARHADMLKADLTSEDAVGWALLDKVAAFRAIPLTVVYGPGVKEPIRLNGIYSSDQLIAALDRAAGGGANTSLSRAMAE